MKRFIIALLPFVIVLSLVACTKTEYPTGLTQVAINETKNAIYHVFGDDVIHAEFDERLEQGGAFVAFITFDGVAENKGIAEFDELCDIMDETSEFCWESYGVDTVIFLVSDKDIDECLYVSENGANITFVFEN